MRPVYGPARQPLDHPATTRLLDRLLADEPCRHDEGFEPIGSEDALTFWRCRICSAIKAVAA